jgi:hypothetical protein
MKNKTTQENKPAEAINCPDGVNENKALTAPEKPLAIVFNGALLRYPDGWRWKDGELAPEISDQLRSHDYDFAVQSAPDTGKCVVVPEFEVANDRALSWVAEGNYEKTTCRDAVSLRKFHKLYPEQGRSKPPAFLVPLDDWRKWGNVVAGASWLDSHTDRIGQKAQSLGVRLQADPAPQERTSPDPAQNTKPKPLCLNEVMLVADALNGANWWLVMDPEQMDRYVNVGGSMRGGCSLVHEVEDAIALNDLDERWEVDGPALIEKLENLPPDLRRKLILGIGEFWDRPDDKSDTVLERLCGQLNRALAPEGGVSAAEDTLAPVRQE